MTTVNCALPAASIPPLPPPPFERFAGTAVLPSLRADVREPRAVIFDLDDTLYPRRQFVVSGFTAVAGYIERFWGVPAFAARAELLRTYRTGRGREFHLLVRTFGLPAWLVPQLHEVVRAHAPVLRLPPASRWTLSMLREGWRLAVVTSGAPDVEARKIEALGLAPLVDAVVHAPHRTGAPTARDHGLLHLVARRLGARAARTVFVGDDPVADIAVARQAGMHTLRLRRRGESLWEAACAADAEIESMDEVPARAMALVDGRRAYAV